MKTPEGPEGASLLEHEATEDCEQSVVSIALSDPKAWCHACKDLAFAAPMHTHAPNIRKCQEAMPMHAPE